MKLPSPIKKIIQKAKEIFSKNQVEELPQEEVPQPAQPTLPDWAPNWQEFINNNQSEWNQLQELAKNGSKILIASSTGAHSVAIPFESMLAVALTVRGANVHFLLCDRFLPTCLLAGSKDFPDETEFINHGPAKLLCEYCFNSGLEVFKPLGLPIHLYSELVTEEEWQKAEELSQSTPVALIPDYRLDDIGVGEQALAGAMRFYARENIEEEPNGELVLRRYFQASLLSTYAIRRLLGKVSFDCAVFHHGIYVPQGLIGEVARQEGVRVVNWQPGYRKQRFVFSQGKSYHYTMASEPVEKWENMAWNSKLESQVVDYLKSRWQGTQDWIGVVNEPQLDLSAISQEIGLDFAKPCIGLLTNVTWDARVIYPNVAFPSMVNWVLKTIEYFSRRPELQLVIRIHPGEIINRTPSRQLMVDEINKAFPSLPSNVFVIPPESKISTYATMLECDSVIIYGTKTGVELTSIGIPVIVVGNAWVRNKGITFDASSVEEYYQILDRLPLKKRLDEATLKRARQYAYHFFFRRMIPLEFMEATNSWPPFKVNLPNLAALTSGKDAGLDIICDGILKGSDFIYPSEQYSSFDN